MEIDQNDLDFDLHNLKAMSFLLEGQVNSLSASRDTTTPITSDYQRFTLTTDQWDAINFVAFHIGDMIREAVEKYHSASKSDLPACEALDDPK